LSRAEFCRTRGLALSTLIRRQRRREQRGQAAGKSRWVTVELSDPKPEAANAGGSGLVLVLGSRRRIEVGRGFDVNTLEQLVRVLEQA
jgi:hypothetical protein